MPASSRARAIAPASSARRISRPRTPSRPPARRNAATAWTATAPTGTGPTWASSMSSWWSKATISGCRSGRRPASTTSAGTTATAWATSRTSCSAPMPAPDTHGAPQTWHSALPVAWHNSTWVGDRTIAYLNAHKDEPFALWASFPDPHHPFDCPVPWSLLHDPDEVDLPPHRTLDLERRPWWHRASLEGKPKIRDGPRQDPRGVFAHPGAQRPPAARPDRQLLRHDRADRPQCRPHPAELHRLGLAENTLVIYATDHGDWLGDHGLILKGPMPYEGLLRVGCIDPAAPASPRAGGRRSGLDPRRAGHDPRLCRRRAGARPCTAAACGR